MKSIKKVLITWMLVSMLGVVFTGCMNREVIVATVNDQDVSEQLYRIFLWSAQRGIESVQPDFWNMDSFEGKTPEEYAKDKALKSVSYCMVVAQKAKELNVKLTDEERTRVKTVAKEAVNAEEGIPESYHIKQKDYEVYYTYALQNEKVKQILGESYEPNDEEINSAIALLKQNGEVENTSTIVHILFDTKNELGSDLPSDKKQAVYEKAQEVLKKALAGEDMGNLAMQYSDDPSVKSNLGKYTFTQGSMEQSVEEVAFNEAYIGKVYPELLETSMGYEIIKVIDVELESEDALREKAAQRIKGTFAEDEINQMVNLAEIKKKAAYEEIHKMHFDTETK